MKQDPFKEIDACLMNQNTAIFSKKIIIFKKSEFFENKTYFDISSITDIENYVFQIFEFDKTTFHDLVYGDKLLKNVYLNSRITSSILEYDTRGDFCLFAYKFKETVVQETVETLKLKLEKQQSQIDELFELMK